MTFAHNFETRQTEDLTGPQIVFLAVAAGVATATSYTPQPELIRIADDLDASLAMTSAAAGLPIVGYMIGLALLVPLVDHLPAKWLLSAQLTALGLSLGLAAIATHVLAFGAALLASGICASTGAQMSTLAGKHVPADRRGRALGAVMAGISAGVLLGRLVGGGLADVVGWRNMLLIVAFLCLACAVGSGVTLPRITPHQNGSYAATLRSMPRLLFTHSDLRAAALSGALWFFAFSLVWTGLSVALALPPLGLSPTVIGLYSLAGVAGVFATRPAGRLADRLGSRPVVLVGLMLALVCALTMPLTLEIAPMVLLALAIFDTGLFSAQVANQRCVLSIDPSKPAPYNSVYMVVYFIGGGLGTAVGGPLVSTLGWSIAALAAATSIALAAAIGFLRRPSLAKAPATPR